MALPNKRQLIKDVQVANNERQRRRRQRRRRAARNRNQRSNTNRRRVPTTHRRGMAAESKQEEAEEEMADCKINFRTILSPSLQRYVEAVVHPFGNEAIGATLPDRYQELVIPLCDRLELDLDPTSFNLPLPGVENVTSWENSSSQLTGVFMWFQPRCIGGGTLEYVEGSDSGTFFNVFPFIGIDDSLSTIDPSVALQAYTLCFTGIWTTPNGVEFGLFDGRATSLAVVPTVIQLPYSRFTNIKDNCDKMRILGAGLKLWSEEAPINTGGYSLGGWATVEDIISAVSTDGGIPNNPGGLKNFQTSIKFASRNPGIKGSTVRYSPLQTQDQAESEYPTLPERFYAIGGAGGPPGSARIETERNVDLAIHDLITPGSFVPCTLWVFNTGQYSESNNDRLNGVYTIKVMSMVHSEGTPTGTSPFMSTKSHHDPATDQVKLMLENPETFPPAVSGHSFKSFFSKVKKVVAHVNKAMPTIAKIGSLVEQLL